MNSSSSLCKHLFSFAICSHVVFLWFSGITPCFKRITAFDCGIAILAVYQRRALADRYILLFLWIILLVIHQENLGEAHDNCLDFQSSVILIFYYFIYVLSWTIITILCIGSIGLFVVGLIADITHERQVQEFGMDNPIVLQQQIRLEPQQLVNLEQNYKRRYSLHIQAETNVCSICLQAFIEEEQVVQLPHCKHIFHDHCIRGWFENSTQCPYCRNNVINLI